jgi:hypothetical protein
MKKSNLVRAIIESTSIVSLLWWVALSIAPLTVAQTPPDLSYNGVKIYKDAKNNVYFLPTPRFGTAGASRRAAKRRAILYLEPTDRAAFPSVMPR